MSARGDGLEEEEDVAEDDSPDGDVMSIFASYYGIETQPASPTDGEGDGDGNGHGGGPHREHKSASDIDSVHFNPEGFVRVLLDNAPIDELLSRDTQMTHEIRALDSDMQMLVYENYNKFISATETIKRMKSNVDAMDGDMDTVRSKMALITASSAGLDESLEGKRQRVDKLVRVRRLLERLEFLSELPEKLASMIAKEQYQRAVQLYRRTIHVLTQHAQVLSFRKIKERTEAMMADLRGRVTDLLADPALEAVKLTQYASTLRLMEAPKAVVCEKLLQAHRARSLQMVKRFTASSAGGGANTTASFTAPSSSSSSGSGSGSSSSSSGNGGSSGSGVQEDEFSSGSSADRTRRFHQDLIVGLVEVCRGLHELYAPHPASLSARPHSKSASVLSPGGGAINSSAVPATPLSLPKEAAASPGEIRAAATQFRALLVAVLPAYKACLVSATSAFFERFNAHSAHHAKLEAALRAEGVEGGAGDKDGAAAQAVRAAQLQHYALDDERQAWVTLVRQTIMDVQFLDREAEACVRELRGVLDVPHQDGFGAAAQYSSDFSLTLLFTLDQHLQQCLERRMGALAAALPEGEASVALVDPPGEPSHAASEAHKRSLSQRTDKARQSSERLADLLMSLLGDLCTDAKEIVDVYSAVAPGSVDEYVLNVVGRFVTAATHACEAACGVCTDMSSERAASRASDLAGNEAEVRGAESFGLAARVRPDGVDFVAPAFSALGGGVRCLLLYATLSGLRPTLAARLERELTAHGLAPGLSLAQPSRLWAEQLDDAACRVLARYVEHHASSCAALVRGGVLEVLGGGGGRGKVGPEMRALVLQLDRLTASCCVALGEGLGQFQKVRLRSSFSLIPVLCYFSPLLPSLFLFLTHAPSLLSSTSTLGAGRRTGPTRATPTSCSSTLTGSLRSA